MKISFKKYIENIGLFLIGVSLIMFVFYFRVIYQRLPKDLHFYSITKINEVIWNYGVIVFISVSVIISITMVYINYKKIINRSIFINPRNMFVKLSLKIYTIIKSALNTVFIFVINLMHEPYETMAKPILGFCFGKYNNYWYIVGSRLGFIVRLIIILCFLVDIFFFFKLNFFYKSLNLLLIPIIFQFWFYILYDWSKNKDYFKEKLDILHENVGTPQEIHKFKFKPAYAHQNLNLAYYIQQYRDCLSVFFYLEDLQAYYDYYNPRFNLLYYSLFLLGCLYVLIVNCLSLI